MGSETFELNEGYEGFQKSSRALTDTGNDAETVAKNQHGYTDDLMGKNKGQFATQAANGSTAAANSFAAGGKVFQSAGEGGQRFVNQAASIEDDAAQSQGAVARTVDSDATDIASKINRA